MKYCAYCNAALPEGAQFCGNCGQVIDVPADGFTRISGVQRSELPGSTNTPAGMSLPGITPITPAIPASPVPPFLSNPQWSLDAQQTAPIESSIPTIPIDDDEERRRRAAMLGIGVAGLGAFPQGNGAPMVQGTPQLGGVPNVQGTPQLQGGSFQNMQPGGQAGSVQIPPHAPPASYMPTLNPPSTSSPTLTLHHHPQGGSSPGSTGSGGSAPKPGCAPILIISAIIIPIIIIASIIGLGLTIFAPSLALSGSSSVSLGGSLALHGSHFLPGGSISLMRDGSTPVFVVSQHSSNATADAGKATHLRDMTRSLSTAQIALLLSSSSTIKAGSDGTFNATITIDPTWSPGQHTINAAEVLTHRSASLSFTILSPFTSPTPSPTVTGTITPSPSPTNTKTPGITPTPGVTPSPTVSPTVTAPTSQPGLSCINPASVSLGPVSENYAQVVSTSVKLCAGGNGVVQWTANWNASQASWLSLSASSGQINAPGQSQIGVSASAAQLGPGNYSATITFTSTSSSATQTLNVSFVVQAGCLRGSPGSLSFSGVANISDPASQTVGLTNCGAVGTWTANTTTADGANWLAVSPTSNTLSNAGSEKITISASNLKSQLAAGFYTGTVTFAVGSGSFVVQVTLTVQPAPTLSANTTSLTGYYDCSSPNGTYICYVTLTNNSKSASLTWTYSAQSIPSLVVKPASFTLAPGQSERVPLYISTNDCSSGASITFTGPANSVNVLWQCYPPIG